MSLGKLEIEVVGKIANFSATMEKAASEADKKARRIEKSMRRVQRVGRNMFSSFTLPAGGLFIGAINEARKFETSLVGVAKTTNLQGKELELFSKKIRTLAKTDLPIGVNSLLEIAQAAGQLGVKGQSNLVAFTDTIAKLGQASDLHGEEAAKTLARLITVTGESYSEVGKLGSVIVRLGNNFAASESEIANMATRVAQSSTAFDVSSAEAAAFGAAMTSVGINAELGGTQVGKTMRAIEGWLLEGGDQMKGFSDITGIAVDDIKKRFSEDAAGVFVEFIGGLKRVKEGGGSVTQAMQELGLKNDRVLAVLPSMVTGYENLTGAMSMAKDELVNTNALNAEAAASFDTFATKINRLKAVFSDLGIAVANSGLIDWATTAITKLTGFVNSLSEINPAILKIVTGIAGVLAVGAPLLLFFTGSVAAISSLTAGIGLVAGAFALLGKAVLAHPVVAIVAAIAAGALLIYKNWDFLKGKFSEIWKSIDDGAKKLAESFNSMVEQIGMIFSNLAKDALEAGKNVVLGLANGIKNGAKAATNAAKNMASDVASSIKDFFTIRSPSKLTEGFGKNVAAGLSVGILLGTPGAVQAAEKLASDVSNTFGVMQSDVATSSKYTFGVLASDANKEIPKVSRALEEGQTKARDYSSTVKDDLAQSFTNVITSSADLADSLKSIWKRMLADFVNSGLTKAFKSLLGGEGFDLSGFNISKLFGSGGGGGGVGGIVSKITSGFTAAGKSIISAAKTAGSIFGGTATASTAAVGNGFGGGATGALSNGGGASSGFGGISPGGGVLIGAAIAKGFIDSRHAKNRAERQDNYDQALSSGGITQGAQIQGARIELATADPTKGWLRQSVDGLEEMNIALNAAGVSVAHIGEQGGVGFGELNGNVGAAAEVLADMDAGFGDILKSMDLTTGKAGRFPDFRDKKKYVNELRKSFNDLRKNVDKDSDGMVSAAEAMSAGFEQSGSTTIASFVKQNGLIDEATGKINDFAGAGESAGRRVTNKIGGIVGAFTDISGAIATTQKDIDSLTGTTITNTVINRQTDASGGGGSSSSSTKYGGGRATGGLVYPGYTYDVAEEGPELVFDAKSTAKLLGGGGTQGLSFQSSKDSGQPSAQQIDLSETNRILRRGNQSANDQAIAMVRMAKEISELKDSNKEIEGALLSLQE